MAEKVKNTGVTKQSGYLYYLDKKTVMYPEQEWLVVPTKVAVQKLLQMLVYIVNQAGSIL